ncbi:MAG: beta-N-acetylhexosaminidase, partial [Kribbellaceae bacterium]|nr:beta-N-acetylhexosaminidase [Kribbellaceae bacterium]
MIPQPTTQQALPDQTFTLQPDATIGTDSAARPIAERLAVQLRRSTGYALPVQDGAGTITLSTQGTQEGEAYELRAD